MFHLTPELRKRIKKCINVDLIATITASFYVIATVVDEGSELLNHPWKIVALFAIQIHGYVTNRISLFKDYFNDKSREETKE